MYTATQETCAARYKSHDGGIIDHSCDIAVKKTVILFRFIPVFMQWVGYEKTTSSTTAATRESGAWLWPTLPLILALKVVYVKPEGGAFVAE
ncbi:hypothetical protein PG995_003813 [Apiospora arundinis]|uniref:Uncharacterized protein n=1 Tax=Apiospora arundinis TaxID=335852 RepID=A0ABR2HQT5_9PEZI